MKKTILYGGMAAIIALTACNGSKTESTEAAAATAQVTTSSIVDLENKGLDGLNVTISVPDSMSKKMTYTKSDYTGALDINAGDNYKMILSSNFASEELPIDSSLVNGMSTVKYNTDPETNKYLINEPYLFMWSRTDEKGVTAYHFYAVFPDGKSKERYFSFGDREGTVHTEAAIRSMIAIAKTIKSKGA